MNTLKINEMIRADSNLLYKAIEALGYEDIKDRGGYFQFPNIDGDNRGGDSFLEE